MTSKIFAIWNLFVIAVALLSLATPIDVYAAPAGVIVGAQKTAQKNAQTQPCPGCDVGVTPGSCSGRASSEAAAAGVRVPYGPGAYRYRGTSGIDNTNRAIGRSMRNLNDSVRRMDSTINRIRNINRRF